MSDIQSAVRIEGSSYKCEKGVKYVDKALFPDSIDSKLSRPFLFLDSPFFLLDLYLVSFLQVDIDVPRELTKFLDTEAVAALKKTCSAS